MRFQCTCHSGHPHPRVLWPASFKGHSHSFADIFTGKIVSVTIQLEWGRHLNKICQTSRYDMACYVQPCHASTSTVWAFWNRRLRWCWCQSSGPTLVTCICLDKIDLQLNAMIKNNPKTWNVCQINLLQLESVLDKTRSGAGIIQNDFIQYPEFTPKYLNNQKSTDRYKQTNTTYVSF